MLDQQKGKRIPFQPDANLAYVSQKIYIHNSQESSFSFLIDYLLPPFFLTVHFFDKKIISIYMSF